MLAAHRDQENLVHSHQGQSKQLPKTPGARNPKTPFKTGQRDENAPIALGGKSVLCDGRKGIENEPLFTIGKTGRQALVTPSDNRTRAPLGNKTTNAKTRTTQKLGPQDKNQSIGKLQNKPTTIQKQKPAQSELQPSKVAVKADVLQPHDEDEEPEYAPPRVEPLPYQSDVLPPGGLSTEGLKKENLFKGYYQHFCNPIDENGISRRDKEFDKEMAMVLREAEEHNERELAALDWHIDDMPKAAQPSQAKQEQDKLLRKTVRSVAERSYNKPASTIASRKAASALSLGADTGKRPVSRASATAKPARKPLTSLLRNPQPKTPAAASSIAARKAPVVASRTTLGYNKGKQASSEMHSRQKPSTLQPSRTLRQAASMNSLSELTITPARIRQQALAKQTPVNETERSPAFVSIFNVDEDDEDLAPVSIPLQLLQEDEDEEFELKLDI